MNGLQEFHFRWADAWDHDINWGIETLLERGVDGTCRILAIANGQHVVFEINEKSFIEALQHIRIEKWDHYNYSRSDILDGDRWKLSVTYNGIHIESKGINGYPPRFLEFLELLHSIGCPKIYYDCLVTTKSIGQTQKEWIEHSSWSSYVDKWEIDSIEKLNQF